MQHKTKHHFMRVLANSSMLMIYFAILAIPVSTIGLLGVKFSYGNGNKVLGEEVLAKQDVRPTPDTSVSLEPVEEPVEVEPKDLPSTAEGSAELDNDFDVFAKELLDSFEATTTE